MEKSRVLKNNAGNAAKNSDFLKVLLIEDSDTDAFLIQRALRRHMKNASCQRVATLGEGEKILERGWADIVLLDLGLPDTAGVVDTYERLKKWTDSIPIVITTRLDDHDVAKNMVHDGAADFVNKDAIAKDSKRVMDAVDFALERHAMHKKLISDKEDALQDSRQKDSILNCFMGGYSVLK